MELNTQPFCLILTFWCKLLCWCLPSFHISFIIHFFDCFTNMVQNFVKLLRKSLIKLFWALGLRKPSVVSNGRCRTLDIWCWLIFEHQGSIPICLRYPILFWHPFVIEVDPIKPLPYLLNIVYMSLINIMINDVSTNVHIQFFHLDCSLDYAFAQLRVASYLSNFAIFVLGFNLRS